jgi:hypothetical protein
MHRHPGLLRATAQHSVFEGINNIINGIKRRTAA